MGLETQEAKSLVMLGYVALQRAQVILDAEAEARGIHDADYPEELRVRATASANRETIRRLGEYLKVSAPEEET